MAIIEQNYESCGSLLFPDCNKINDALTSALGMFAKEDSILTQRLIWMTPSVKNAIFFLVPEEKRSL